MVFSSSIFLLMFLPIVFILNYFVKQKYSNSLLLIASLFFYAWGEPVLVLLIMASIFVNWIVGLSIGRTEEGIARKTALIIGVICNLGILGYYKYTGFIVPIINGVFHREILTDPMISLPIGISFFTFQAISYIVDVYKGDAEASPKLVKVALYISFFPQLIAGSIVKYRDINKQIENRHISWIATSVGFKGLFNVCL